MGGKGGTNRGSCLSVALTVALNGHGVSSTRGVNNKGQFDKPKTQSGDYKKEEKIKFCVTPGGWTKVAVQLGGGGLVIRQGWSLDKGRGRRNDLNKEWDSVGVHDGVELEVELAVDDRVLVSVFEVDGEGVRVGVMEGVDEEESVGEEVGVGV